jgi:hypothetical protein
MKVDELGRACGSYGREMREGFRREILNRDHLEDFGLDGRIILRFIQVI